MAVAGMRLRRAVIDTVLRMTALGINQGRSGNVSARFRDGMLITPSGIAYEALSPSDIVFVRADGSHEGGLLPSSEWRFHRDILAARPEAGAVVHAHSVNATALACLRRDIPAFHYMVAVAGGDSIRCARYATYGTQALSDHALEALEGRKACLLANHGLVAFGRDLAQALEIAVEVETLAQQYLKALQAGQPVLLSAAEMAEVLERYATYGTQPKAARRGRGQRMEGRRWRGA